MRSKIFLLLPLFFLFFAPLHSSAQAKSDCRTGLERVEKRLAKKFRDNIESCCPESNVKKFVSLDIFEATQEGRKVIVEGQFTYNCAGTAKKEKTEKFKAEINKILGDYAILKILHDAQNDGTYTRQIFP